MGGFIFPSDTDRWVGILRIGLGLQVFAFGWALRGDWKDLFGGLDHGLISRELSEAFLAGESFFIPRLDWFVELGRLIGLEEGFVLSAIWFALLLAGISLIAGIFCRGSAITAWLLYLASAKSGTFSSYGVDNFTTIGLFYLVFVPLPDRWAWDANIRRKRIVGADRLGFHRRILQIHLCIIYFFAGISKSLGPDWWNGNSIWRALTRPPFDVVDPDCWSDSISFSRPREFWSACWRQPTRSSFGLRARGRSGSAPSCSCISPSAS